MKKLIPLLLAFPLSVFAEPGNDDPYVTISMGVGMQYGGLGINLTRVSDHDLKYLSVGWLGQNANDDNFIGLTVGWLRTDLFNLDSNRHGFGISLGRIGWEQIDEQVGNGEYIEHDRYVYGVGLDYVYFSKGIGRPGKKYGVSLIRVDSETTPSVGIGFSMGYRF
jgi:hypothetical protein